MDGLFTTLSNMEPENKLGPICKRNRWRIAVAESCTGGMVGSRITSVPGSSEYFSGGVIAYSNQLKIALLGVPSELIDKEGAVSEAVARTMAVGVVRATGVQVGLSITGVAGPGSSDQKPPGTVHIAVKTPKGLESKMLSLAGSRKEIRELTVSKALEFLVEALEKTDS
ncbi:MAG: CinA family protein [Deltaproteobacteria bacterium]|nr:CinA family protein [Deltaproteobacteria bacterium]